MNPEFENDSYLFRMRNVKLNINNPKFKNFLKCYINYEYYTLKRNKFAAKDITRNGFEKFEDRPSLRSSIQFLHGTIYTYAMERLNGIPYHVAIDNIKDMVKLKSRKCTLRFAEPIFRYHEAEIFRDIDVTCLNLIHYFEDKVTLVFRASDIKNELIVDLLTIYEFFIAPIYNYEIDIEVYAITAQNIDHYFKVLYIINQIENWKI